MEYIIPLCKYNPINLEYQLIYTSCGVISWEDAMREFARSELEGITEGQRRIIRPEGIYYPDYDIIIDGGGFKHHQSRLRVLGLFDIMTVEGGLVFNLDSLEYICRYEEIQNLVLTDLNLKSYIRDLHGRTVSTRYDISLVSGLAFDDKSIGISEMSGKFTLLMDFIPIIYHNNGEIESLYSRQIIGYIPYDGEMWRNKAKTVFINNNTLDIFVRTDKGYFITLDSSGNLIETIYPFYTENYTPHLLKDNEFTKIYESVRGYWI